MLVLFIFQHDSAEPFLQGSGAGIEGGQGGNNMELDGADGSVTGNEVIDQVCS